MSDDVRQGILDAATRLFARKGYGSTSVREVVEAAGVTKPTLYYWFDNKEALFLEAVNTHLRHLDRLVTQTVEGEGTVRERLETFVRCYVRGALSNPDAVRLLMTVQHPTERGRPTVDVMSLHLRKMELLGTLLREGVARGEIREDLDLRDAVVCFIGMVNLQLMTRLHGMAPDDDVAPRIVDLFFRGVNP